MVPDHAPKESSVPTDPPPVAAKAPEPALKKEGAPTELTPEEQMARFAEELKEQDWGHQPC